MQRKDPLRLSVTTAILVATAACSSDGTSPPPAAQSIQVSVATSGFHLDPDGYTVQVGAREATVDADDTVTFEELQPGSYSVQLTGLQENCTASDGPSVDLVLAEGETKSVSFDITCAYDMSGAVLPVVACPGLAPATDHGMPGDEIALGALPTALQPPLFARASWGGRDDALLSYVDPDSATMVVPLHLGSLLDGGAVEVRISDDTVACAPFLLTVDPLPPAPGEFAAAVTQWQELVVALARVAGVTVAELRETPVDELPLPVQGLAIAQAILDHPESPNSLRAIADGFAPDLGSVDMDHLDALTGAVGMGTVLEARIAAAWEGVAMLEPSPSGSSVAPSIGNAMDCLAGIPDEVALDICMTLARDQIKGKAEEKYLGDLGNVLSALQTIPGAPWWVGELLQVFSGVILLEGHYAAYLAGALPTEFVSMSVQPDPPFFYEDTPGPGSWTPAMVVATSTGWSTDKLMQDLMLSGLKLSDAYTSFLKKGGEKFMAATGRGEGYEEYVTNLIGEVASKVVEKVFNVSITGPGLPPKPFGPIPLRSETYVTSRMVLDEFVVRTGHDALDPRKPGTDYLHVITAADRFGGVNVETDPVIPIEVRQMELDFWDVIPSPVNEIFVSPGDTVPLELVVKNAKFPRMVKLEELLPEWGSAQLTLGGDPDAEGTAVHTVRYIAPLDLEHLPGELTAVSTSSTGAIQYTGGFRRAKLVIRPYLVEITTEPPCLEPGASLQIDVQVKGFPEDELVWSADAGTITQSGLFTAPGDASEVRVTVEWSEDAKVKDSLLLKVGGCTCEGTLVVDGQGAVFDVLRFYLTEDLSAVWQVDWVGPNTNVGFTFGDTPGELQPVPLGVTGTVPALGGGYVDGVGSFINTGPNYDPPMPAMTSGISENDGGNVLAGSVTGWVQLMGVENPVAFSMTYRIVADPAFSEPDRRTCAADPG